LRWPKIFVKANVGLPVTKVTKHEMGSFADFVTEKTIKIKNLSSCVTKLQKLQGKKQYTDIEKQYVSSPTLTQSTSKVENHSISSNVGLWGCSEFEEIVVDVTLYRSVLEQTYFDDDHDDWHGDGMPQKFRAGDHTYDEMKIALARFIQRIHGHEAEVTAAVIAFEKSQETLSEHRDYLKQQKLCLSHKTPQSKKNCELAWQDCMRAYKKLPEYKVLMFAKKRQCLFDPLMDKQPSKEHVQDLVNSLATN
jgi:hypothetical protein